MEESILIAVQSALIDDLALVRVARYYAGAGWTVSRVEGCHPLFSEKPIKHMGDLAWGERVQRSTIAAELLTIEVDMTRLPHGKSGKRQNRILRYGWSYIECRLREHPITIEANVAPAFWQYGKERRRAPKHAEHVLEEVRALSENVDVAWIILDHPELGRAPALPELLLPSPQSHTDLVTIFFSAKHFDEAAVRSLADSDTRFEAWPSGWFLSRSPVFHDALRTRGSLGQPTWRLLSSWARRQAHLRRSK